MRWWCLVLLLLVPPGQAQVAMEDATGDVAWQGPAGGHGVPYWAAADLVGAGLNENETGFLVSLQVASLEDDPPVVLVQSTYYALYLQHRGALYRLDVDRRWPVMAAVEGPHLGAELLRLDATTHEVLETVDTLDAWEETTAGRLHAFVPRDLLLDETGAPPFAGRTLSGFFATADASEAGIAVGGSTPLGIPWPESRFTDRMPDEGAWPEPLAVHQGGAGNGLRIGSPDPFRLSNGEATTFLFSLEVRNDLLEDAHVVLEATEAPSSWQVHFPEPTVWVPAGAMREVPVAVRVPFAHQHGGHEEVVVEAQSGDATATTRVGVRYTEVPQPSGHHSRLWIHSLEPSSPYWPDVEGAYFLDEAHPFMSTLEEDPASTGRKFGSHDIRIPLRPSLGMGLQFTGGPGAIAVPLESETPADSLRISGSLDMVDRNGSATPLFEIRHDGSGPAAAGEVHMVEALLEPTEHATRIPYAAGKQLVLHIQPSAEYPASDPIGSLVWIHPGGTVDLPFDEYADTIEDLFSTWASVTLTAAQQARSVNAGGTTVFDLHVANHGHQRLAPAFHVAGLNADWARPVAPVAPLGPGEAADMQVAVAAPSGAAAGEVADLLVEAHAEGRIVALLRLVATVVDEPVPDESHLVVDAGAGKRSPMPAWPLLALVLAFWARRLLR